MSIFEKITGPKDDIIKYLERYEKSWVAEELLIINNILSNFEVIGFISLILTGIIITIIAFCDFGFLALPLGYIITFLTLCWYLFLTRLRRLRFFVKIENIILLEEIKMNLDKQ